MTKEWDYLVSDEKFEALIRNYCTDFTQLEREGRYGPITGRDKEIKDATLILLQKGRKNVAFLAPAGVGKTAAVVGLAQQVVKGNVPDYLKTARVIEVDLSRMASGTTTRAEFQDRFLPLCKGVAERYHNPDEPRYILFIDEFHQLMPNCVGSSYAGLADTMKPYLTAGDLLVVAATTLDEFRMYVAQDPAMDRRFQKVFLKVPNIEETYTIMKALRPGFEKHHKVTLTNEDLMLIVHLTEEHMRKRNQPDKSIITADAAMAYHVLEHGINQPVALESIYYMVARETGLNARAMHDEKQLAEIKRQVGILEGDIIEEKKETSNQPYDPSANLKDVEMDKNFQMQLDAERDAAQKAIKDSTGTDSDKKDQLDELEERLAEKIAARLEEKAKKEG
ncbi:MAG: AAA family ATPase [Alphaproteobacteria bacterium]